MKINKKLINLAKKSNGVVSSKEYKEAMCSNKKNKNLHVKARDFLKEKTKKEYNIGNFNLTIKTIIRNKEYLFTIKGNHLSNNTINSLPFRKKLNYKSAIKKAFYIYSIEKRDFLKEIDTLLPFKKVIFYPTSYVVRSRDDDNEGITLKIIRDAIIRLGFVEDDNRKFVTQEKCNEIISKDKKLEIKMIIE